MVDTSEARIEPTWLVNRVYAKVEKNPLLLRFLSWCTECGDGIITRNDLEDRDVTYVSKATRRGLTKKLGAHSDIGGMVGPSSGIVAIEHFVVGEKWSEFETCILGFSHHGWWGHPWKAEEALVADYSQKGVLKILDDAPA